MSLVVRIDIKGLNKKQKDTFDKLFAGKRSKYVIAKKANTILIRPILLDAIEMELLAKREFNRKLDYSLIDMKKENGKTKAKVIVKKGKIRSDNYNAILRHIRY